MNLLLAVPILLPLLGAGLSMIVGRSRAAQRTVSLTVLTVVMGCAIAIAIHVDRVGPLSLQAGGWRAPIGISLVADRLSATMLAVASVMLVAVMVYAIGQPGAERNHVGFQSVYLIMAAGVAGSFLPGDLFNLFVSFEMMLAASYVLITIGARKDQVRSGMSYVVISLLASTFFVVVLALVYSATGTLNLADLSVRMGELSPGLRSGFSLMMLIVFGIKAGLFPLFFWLPDSYPTAPSAVTAVFAGLLTKVGVYAIIRTQTLLFDNDSRPDRLILVLAAATMVVGVLGAIAQDDVKRILSFHIVSHVGFMVMGLGFFTVAGLGAALFYIVHHIVVMTTLFLTGGLIEHVGGSSRLSRVGGLVRSAPGVAVLFALPALSLAGLPPFSGFVAKVGLIDAGVRSERYAIIAVSLVVSLMTLFSMTKIWSAAFWGEEPELCADDLDVLDEYEGLGLIPGGHDDRPPLMVIPTAVLAAISIGIAVFAGPLHDLSTRAAEGIIDPDAYYEVVEP
ncbi:MAG TPA: Na+/H+ antiporter subunit D [Microthrixaceae bacterium]|nr:Na+/H+ antiporter subunit D [Microthrixaceae bacterium]